MNNYFKKCLIALSLIFILFSMNTISTLAASGYYTISYADKGVKNIEIPSELAIITRTEYYNTKDLYDYGVDPNAIRSNMNGTNTYVCAMSYDGDYEIDIDFYENDSGVCIGDFVNFTSTELEETFGVAMAAGASNVKTNYVEMDGTPTIKVTAYIDDLNQYLVGYLCTSESNGKYYGILFKLYTYGSSPTTLMNTKLNHMVNNAVISQPESTYDAIYESAEKAAMKDMAGETLYKVLVGIGSGAIMGLIVSIINRKKRRSYSNTKSIDDVKSNYNENQVKQLMNDVVDDTLRECQDADVKQSDNQTIYIKETQQQKNEERNTVIESPVQGKLFCRKCGTQLPIDSDFCNRCGEKVIRLKK